MKTYTLPCEKRDLAVKAKSIRKNGFVPAVVCGRHIDSLSIQIKKGAATKLLQFHSIGAKVLLTIDGEEQLSIIKDYHRDPISGQILHIDFHALTSGEKVKVTIPVVFANRDSLAQGFFLQESMSEIEISTLPQYLVDHISVDVSKYSLGDSVYVSDLDVSKDENIEVLSSPESLVCSVTHAAKYSEEPEEGEEESAEAEEAAETAEE